MTRRMVALLVAVTAAAAIPGCYGTVGEYYDDGLYYPYSYDTYYSSPYRYTPYHYRPYYRDGYHARAYPTYRHSGSYYRGRYTTPRSHYTPGGHYSAPRHAPGGVYVTPGHRR